MSKQILRFIPALVVALSVQSLGSKAQASCESDLIDRCPDCGYELLCNEVHDQRVQYDNPLMRACVIKTVWATPYYFQIEEDVLKERQGFSFSAPRSDKAERVIRECADDVWGGRTEQMSPVRVVGEANYHSKIAHLKETNLAVGGLSGIAVDLKNQRLLAVTDSKHNSSLTEVFWSVAKNDSDRPIRFQLGDRIALYQEKTVSYEKRPVVRPPDPNEGFFGRVGRIFEPTKMETVKVESNKWVDREDIVLLPDGRIVISSEESDLDARADDTASKAKLPSLLQVFNLNGELLGDLKTPVAFKNEIGKVKKSIPCLGSEDRFQPAGGCFYETEKEVAGLSRNKGIEALTSIPGTETILFANEAPLVQDAEKSRRLVRIYSAKVSELKSSAPERFVKYPLDAMEDGGLVAMAALDGDRVLTLERGFDAVKRQAIVHMHMIRLSRVDSSGVLEKKPIVDFKDLRNQFAAGFRKIDNFEGLAVGPVIAGRQIVFAISDNNFSSEQRTVVLALDIPQEMIK